MPANAHGEEPSSLSSPSASSSSSVSRLSRRQRRFRRSGGPGSDPPVSEAREAAESEPRTVDPIVDPGVMGGRRSTRTSSPSGSAVADRRGQHLPHGDSPQVHRHPVRPGGAPPALGPRADEHKVLNILHSMARWLMDQGTPRRHRLLHGIPGWDQSAGSGGEEEHLQHHLNGGTSART